MTGATKMESMKAVTLNKCEMCLMETKYYYQVSYSVVTPGSNLAKMKTSRLCGECAHKLIEEERVVRD